MKNLFEMFNVEVAHSDKEVVFKFPYSRSASWTRMKDEMKLSMGARFKKDPVPHWRAPNNGRTWWVIDLLSGKNPYERYHTQPTAVDPRRPELFTHQREALSFILDKKRCILAAEMGTGKTLAIIEALEIVQPKWAWYIAPRFAIGSLKIMFRSWNAMHWPQFMSYDELKKATENWPAGKKAPDFIVFDESAYIKNEKSQRTQCAMHLANGMRQDHDDPYIIAMSGAPAPKSPKDWWAQAEVVCPGFLKERGAYDFEHRLGLFTDEKSFAGVGYSKLATWWDDENKCKHCGEFKDHANHLRTLDQKKEEMKKGLAGLLDIGSEMTYVTHTFEPSTNEVANLHRRMSGLVLVQFKKDVLTELPDKTYRIVEIEPSKKILRAAALINRTSTKTVEALTRLRELSDGFQYKSEPSGEFTNCPRCAGAGLINEPDVQGKCPNCTNGQVEKFKRVANRVPCPKDDALRELLEECGDRIVIFGGFTETIDRIVDVCTKAGWDAIRADGTTSSLPDGIWSNTEFEDHPLEAFQNKEKYERPIAFIAHPATAKTSLTLTASSMLVYYSNTFNGDDRIQSEDRIHRIGMDVNKGAVIVDLIHLESDRYVRENLRKKRVLQSITLGELQEFMNASLQEKESIR